MPDLIVMLSLLMASIFWGNLSHSQGIKDGWREADRHYERVISDRVSEGIQGYRRVQGIREQAEYDRGRRSCHE